MRLKHHNSTKQVTEFILIGFQLPRPLEVFLFVVLLVLFLLALAGNVTIIALVSLDQRLQTPMYFFLCNLSLMDIFFVLSIIPKMLVNLISRNKSIPLLGCASQCYFYFFLGASETIIIALMAFDRYVAICHPLRYTIIMSGKVCTCLVLICWIGSCLSMLGPMFLLFHLPFCGSNVIDHFFCDYAPMVRLSCSDLVPFLLTLETVLSAAMLLSSMSATALSYLYIFATVLRTHPTKAWQKTFSTCASHITVASIFYGNAIFMYSLPSQGRSQDAQKAVAIVTAVITPLLNPFIYSLRNKKVNEAFRDCVKRRKSSAK